MRRSGPTILLHFHHWTWTCRYREAQDVRERPSLAVRCRKLRLSLLLASRQTGSRFMQPIFHFFEETGLLQAGDDNLVASGSIIRETINSWSIGDIIVNRLGKGLGF